VSSAPERVAPGKEKEVASAPPEPAQGPPDEALPELTLAPAFRCRRCQKRIVDLEIEVYFGQSGLCFWCAYVDSQG
jgi:hypothetical protein